MVMCGVWRALGSVVMRFAAECLVIAVIACGSYSAVSASLCEI